MLLARIVIAKIEDMDGLVNIFRTTPCVQNDPKWRCRSWVAEVLERIRQEGNIVGTSVLSWPEIEQRARDYVSEKAAEGRYGTGADMSLPKPTYNLYMRREVIP